MVQMPLAMVSCIIPSIPHHVADCGYIKGHIIYPREISIVEHAGVLDMLAGKYHRS